MTSPMLDMTGIVKDFPGVRALDGASLSLLPGEVHGLVGENGAGKSTLIKVLAGVYRADEGRVAVGGETIDPVTPAAVHRAGVRFIHQELHLVPHFTVTEAVFMAQEVGGWAGLERRAMRARAEAFLHDTFGSDLSGDRLVRDLGTAERKLVQIARALIDDAARVVVFDEPTAPLASGEIAVLMRAIRALAARGIAVLYVSHYLGEITDLCDRVTVFRQGETVGVFDEIGPDTGRDLVTAMVGRGIADMFPARRPAEAAPLLELRGLGDGAHFEDVDLTLAKGEILGLAGLIGSGREELIDAVYGLRPVRAGEVRLEGRRLRTGSPARAVRNGLVLVPRDRRHDGLVLPMTTAENVTLATLEQVSRLGIERKAARHAAARTQIAALDIRPPAPDAVTRFLSGGNQQKVVLGRWLARDARVFLMDEPTVGVDVGAKAEIYQLIADLAAKGAGIVVSSSDPMELVGLCHRIGVMMRGRLTHVLDAEGLGVDDLVAETTGAAGDVGARLAQTASAARA